MLKALSTVALLAFTVGSLALQATSQKVLEVKSTTVDVKVTQPPVAIGIPLPRRMDAAVQALVIHRELKDRVTGEACFIQTSIAEFLDLEIEDVNVLAHARVNLKTNCFSVTAAENNFKNELRKRLWEKSEQPVYIVPKNLPEPVIGGLTGSN